MSNGTFWLKMIWLHLHHHSTFASRALHSALLIQKHWMPLDAIKGQAWILQIKWETEQTNKQISNNTRIHHQSNLLDLQVCQNSLEHANRANISFGSVHPETISTKISLSVFTFSLFIFSSLVWLSPISSHHYSLDPPSNESILSLPCSLGPAYRGVERAGHGVVRLRQGPVPAALPVHQAAGEAAAAHKESHAESSGSGPGRQSVALWKPAELDVDTGGWGDREGGAGGG